mmetsp:Transcript_9935/g.19497  ORF Transcript_9935/g.19497 Transcript_9935/m.19497 type:complete len:835 (-) Transcript_9935:5-2509(-)
MMSAAVQVEGVQQQEQEQPMASTPLTTLSQKISTKPGINSARALSKSGDARDDDAAIAGEICIESTVSKNQKHAYPPHKSQGPLVDVTMEFEATANSLEAHREHSEEDMIDLGGISIDLSGEEFRGQAQNLNPAKESELQSMLDQFREANIEDDEEDWNEIDLSSKSLQCVLPSDGHMDEATRGISNSVSKTQSEVAQPLIISEHDNELTDDDEGDDDNDDGEEDWDAELDGEIAHQQHQQNPLELREPHGSTNKKNLTSSVEADEPKESEPRNGSLVDSQDAPLTFPPTGLTLEVNLGNAADVSKSPFPPASEADIVQFNVGGRHITTTIQTISRADWLMAAYARGEEDFVQDRNGNIFIDRDPAYVDFYMRILRSTKSVEEAAEALLIAPPYGSPAFRDMVDDARFFRFEPVLAVLRKEAISHVDQATATIMRDLEYEKAELTRKLKRASKHNREDLRIEIRRVELELSKALILNRHRRDNWEQTEEPDLKFNLIIVGNSGAGKSSTMQTLLNNTDCVVAGGQAQGTRGTILRDGSVDGTLMSYIDTQGLGADTSVTDVELLEQIMLSTEAIMRMKVISNVLMAMDLRDRATPAVVGNYLTFTELFTELQGTCLLCFTKWNTNNVMAEWNKPLRAWRRKWRRAKTIEEITEPPPSYIDLYEAYTNYLNESLAEDLEDTAFAKLVSVLSFFDSRIVWAFNLDAEQQSQREEGTLEPYIEVMYRYYRDEAIKVLEGGRHEVPTASMQFLRHDRDTLKQLAFDLIRHRNQHLGLLEGAARDRHLRQRIKYVFTDMVKNVTVKLAHRNYSESEYVQQVAGVVGVARKTMSFGCSIS